MGCVLVDFILGGMRPREMMNVIVGKPPSWGVMLANQHRRDPHPQACEGWAGTAQNRSKEAAYKRRSSRINPEAMGTQMGWKHSRKHSILT